MKKLIFVTVMLVSISCFASAGKNAVNPTTYTVLSDSRDIPASQVPDAVRASFREMFPTARNVQWGVKREDGRRIFEAEFTRNGKRFEADFSPDGTLIKLERKGGDNSGSGS
jgi:hypothetical protein